MATKSLPAAKKQANDRIFKAYAEVYRKVYLRTIDFYSYDEASDMMTLYVDQRFKVLSASPKRVKALTTQLKHRNYEESPR